MLNGTQVQVPTTDSLLERFEDLSRLEYDAEVTMVAGEEYYGVMMDFRAIELIRAVAPVERLNVREELVKRGVSEMELSEVVRRAIKTGGK